MCNLGNNAFIIGNNQAFLQYGVPSHAFVEMCFENRFHFHRTRAF